jgi:hypothetical protein
MLSKRCLLPVEARFTRLYGLISMDDINDYMFVFYWRNQDKGEWSISQPVSMGELIDGGVELEFMNGDSLPLNDVNWGKDGFKVVQVPARKYVHTKP